MQVHLHAVQQAWQAGCSRVVFVDCCFVRLCPECVVMSELMLS
jgi:hypothetical protein